MAEKVVRTASCPVLTIRSEAFNLKCHDGSRAQGDLEKRLAGKGNSKIKGEKNLFLGEFLRLDHYWVTQRHVAINPLSYDTGALDLDAGIIILTESQL